MSRSGETPHRFCVRPRAKHETNIGLSSPSDAYHTAYVLAGLSAAQHTWSPPTRDENAWTTVFPYLDDVQIYENVDRLRTVHPVYVIPPRKAEEMMAYFKAKESF